MERVAEYKKLVGELIERYGAIQLPYGEVENEVEIDHENGHYQLSSVGWRGSERIHGSVLHIDVKNNKIWIQHDGTDVGVANELVDLGVPKEDIILAFYPLYKRPYTGFGVN